MKKYSPIILIAILILAGITFVVLSNAGFWRNAEGASTSSSVDASLDTSIAKGEKEVAANPVNTKPYIDLASLYLQKARETSDSVYYEKIDALMDAAQKLDPTDADVPALRAAASYGEHNFEQGYSFINQAIAINSTRPAYFGLRGDGEIELGKYEDAAASFQKMIDLRPDFASWSRVAYIRELYGDVPGAKDAIAQAIGSGSSYKENIAWAYVELGKLDMRDNLPKAEDDFNNALNVLPTYTQAMEGLGKVAFAKGDTTEAEKQFMNAYDGLPLAQYAVDLGDLYKSEGDTAKASQYYALAQVAFQKSTDGGVNVDLEESLFLSDHDLDLPDALAMAQRAYAARPSIYGADYLAWALYKNGKASEASKYTAQALRLGENDPLIMFDQGEIALANQDRVHAKEYLAKAYALNPQFSVQYQSKLKADLDSLTGQK